MLGQILNYCLPVQFKRFLAEYPCGKLRIRIFKDCDCGTQFDLQDQYIWELYDQWGIFRENGRGTSVLDALNLAHSWVREFGIIYRYFDDDGNEL